MSHNECLISKKKTDRRERERERERGRSGAERAARLQREDNGGSQASVAGF